MKQLILLVSLIIFGLGGAFAQTKKKAISQPSSQSKKVTLAKNSAKSKPKKSSNVTYINPKKVILKPGSYQSFNSGDATLVIEFKSMHKSGKFPIVKIQDIPFKMTKKGEKIEFTWQKAGFELVWLKKGQGNEVALMSSEPFSEKTFSLKTTKVKHRVIKKGLIIDTKRRDGVISSLEILNVQKGSKGKMIKYSTLTYANKKLKSEYHSENYILAPLVSEQYEKAVNGEVLYIFTSNKKGQVEVYYR